MCTYNVINSYDYAIQVFLQVPPNLPKISVDSASLTWSFVLGYVTPYNNQKTQIRCFVFAHTPLEAATSLNG